VAAAKGKGTKGKSKAKSSTVKKSSVAKPVVRQSNGNAVLVLIILTLLAAVVILVNKNYFNGVSTIKKDTQRTVSGEPEKKYNNSGKNVPPEKAALESDAKKDNKQETAQLRDVPERDVKIYLLMFNEKTEKTVLYPVRRKIKSDEPVVNSLRELIKGPTRKEKEKNLLTAVPGNLVVRGVVIKDKTAVIDFNEAIEFNAVGNILINRIDQILYTATQFDSVESVLIQVNGKPRKFIGGDGLSLGGPLSRKHR